MMATAMSQESICSLVEDGTLELEREAGRIPAYNAVVMTEDTVLVIGYHASNLQVHSRHDGKLYTSHRLGSIPWDVCLISKTELAVCLEYSSKILILSFESVDDVKLVKTLDVETGFDWCHSVAKWNSDKLVVSGEKYKGKLCWSVVSITDGRVHSTHNICIGDGYTHLAIQDNTVYISCWTDDSITTGVYAYDILNPHTQKFLYQHKELNDPGRIMADRYCVYVIDRVSKRIHQLTDSGQLVTIHTVSSDPYGIFYDDQHGVLYTTRSGSNLITVYKMEYLHKTDSVIPAEVLKMDTTSLQMYKEALNDGKEKVYNIRVMVVGQYGVGKTTLTQRLLGKNVNISERHSTDGIDVHVECSKVSMPAGVWTTQEKDVEKYSRLQRLVKLLNERVQKQESEGKQGRHVEMVDIVTSEVHDSRHPQYSHPVSAERDISEEVKPPPSHPVQSPIARVVPDASSGTESKVNENDTIMEILQLVNENLGILEKSMVEYAALALWDFAGQYVFYTTHQTFLTSRAIYLLVTDLSQQVTDLITDDKCFLDCDGIKVCKVHDLSEIWLNSIHSCEPTSRPGIPPVILVGTHVDRIPENCRQRVINDYFMNLREMLGGKPAVLHVVDDIAIDNTQVDPRLEELKKRIFELAKQQPHWGEEKPARWLPLEHKIMTLKASGVKVAPRSLIEKINRSGSVRIEDRAELDLFLRFQHEMGTILYFSIEVLREKIVLDPQWLIDAQKSLITAETFTRQNPAIITKWHEFRKSGKLTHELLDAVWSKEKNPEFHDNKDHIILLMEKLNIIARPRTFDQEGKEIKVENYFLAPCMLNDITPREIIFPNPQPERKNSSVLCYVFIEQFLPTPIFHRLLAACIAHWPIAKRKNSENLIFCGCCVFQLDLHHKLTVFFREHVIFVRMTRTGTTGETLSTKLCISVKEFINITLSNIIRNLEQSLRFELYIQCPKSEEYSVNSLISVADLQGNVDVPCHFHNDSHVILSCEVLSFWFEEEGKEDSLQQQQELDIRESSGFRKDQCKEDQAKEVMGSEERIEPVNPKRSKKMEQWSQRKKVDTGANKNKTGLMKAETDLTMTVFVHKLLVQQAMSVGIIRSPSICGTGFRVGSCYIMTAKHVVDGIMNAAAVPLEQESGLNRLEALGSTDVFIDFSYEIDKLTSDANFKFHFEPRIIYANDELDTVILKLKRDTTRRYPPPLKRFTKPSKHGRHGYFIGHPKAEIKKTDKYECVFLTPEEIIAARDWSMKRVNMDGFVGIDDSRRVLLHCSFEGGASGAPGFFISPVDGKAYVLLMLLRGYPIWYYDDKYKDKRTGIHHKDLIEQGVYMESIWHDMKRSEPSLCQEIFKFDDEDDEMEAL